MDKFVSVVKYLLENYPKTEDLSASRLTKLVYLSDWKSALESDCQLTSTEWYFDHFGPYVDTLKKLSDKDVGIESYETYNAFGNKKTCFRLNDVNTKKDLELLTPSDVKIIDFVIKKTHSKNYNDFIKLVYSTYPVANSERYDTLDLPLLASRYKEMLSENRVI